jgi:hypothetical protein
MTDYELAKINEERMRKGLPPLTRTQAATLVVSAPDRTSPGFNSFDFLIGYGTGFGFTPEGMLGAMFHHNSDSLHASDPTPSYTTPDTISSSSSDNSSSYDSGSSSSDSGSSSSSSDGG